MQLSNDVLKEAFDMIFLLLNLLNSCEALEKPPCLSTNIKEMRLLLTEILSKISKSNHNKFDKIIYFINSINSIYSKFNESLMFLKSYLCS